MVELDTVRGNLISVSASSDAGTQEQLASEVRSLRERMGAVADGIGEAYEKPAVLDGLLLKPAHALHLADRRSLALADLQSA